MEISVHENDRNFLLESFPKSVQKFLKDVDNPLDEIQVITSLFSNTNVRIIICNTVNEFDINESLVYFNLNDIEAEFCITVSDVQVYEASALDKSVVYSECEDSLYINETDLKNILLKSDNSKAVHYREWLINQSKICTNLMRHMMIVRHKNETNKLRLLISDYEMHDTVRNYIVAEMNGTEPDTELDLKYN